MSGILDGRVAVIVGGTGGIGAASAKRLAVAGAKVVVCGHSDLAKAQHVADSLPGQGHLANVSITDSASLTALANAVRAAYGRTDMLVNTAGLTKPVRHGDRSKIKRALQFRLHVVTNRGSRLTRCRPPSLARPAGR
jgi:3-oxoacyl-[acyl-carrier protein] reductase